jgi:hypothetical protein
LENHRIVLVFLLQLCSTAAAALTSHVRHLRRLRAVLRQATCRPSTCPAAPRPRGGFSSPHHATCCLSELLLAAARRRCKTISTTSCFPMIPRVTPLPCRRPPDLVLSCTRVPHIALLLPELRRAATRTAGVPAPVSERPHLLRDPEHILELLAHLPLRLHTRISLNFSCSDHLPSPDLRRHPWPSSTTAHTTPEPRSSATRAPP